MWISFAFISAIFSAMAAIAEKKTLKNISALTFSLGLAVFNAILSTPFLYVANLHTVSFIAVLILFLKSILGASSFLLVMNGLKKLEISGSLPLLVLTPALTAILAFIFLKEQLSTIEIIGMLILLVGTYLLQLKKDEKLMSPFLFLNQSRAYLYILGAVLIFSVTTILDKAILGNYKMPPTAFLPLQHFFFVAVFVIYFLLSKEPIHNLTLAFKSSWKLILLISAFTIIYRYTHILAIKAGSVALVLSVKRTSVFFAAILGGHYFKEENLLKKAIAILLMILGAIFIING